MIHGWKTLQNKTGTGSSLQHVAAAASQLCSTLRSDWRALSPQWQCSDRYIISLSPHLHIPSPQPFSPSLISRTVSVDVKHHGHTYLHPPSLDAERQTPSTGLPHPSSKHCHNWLRNRSPKIIVQDLCESRGGRPGLSVLTSLLVSVEVKQYWSNLSLICQLTSEDIKHHFIISKNCQLMDSFTLVLKRL